MLICVEMLILFAEFNVRITLKANNDRAKDCAHLTPVKIIWFLSYWLFSQPGSEGK